jgi:hypothetical protein
MTELQFNLLGKDGKQVFITPRIMVNIGKEQKPVPAKIALQVGYIFQALVNQNASALGAKTKGEAGKELLVAVQALPVDSTLTLYMPTSDDKRDSADMKDWTSVVTVKRADMVATCEAMTLISKTIAETYAKVGKYTFEQPVYYTGEQVAKTRGGTKNITSLF